MPAAHRPLDGSAGVLGGPSPESTVTLRNPPIRPCAVPLSRHRVMQMQTTGPSRLAQGIFCCQMRALRDTDSCCCVSLLQGLCVRAGRRSRNGSGGGAARGQAATGRCEAAARAVAVLLLVRLPPHSDGAGRCQRGSLVAAAALQHGKHQVSQAVILQCCKLVVRTPDQQSVILLQVCV